MNLKSGSLLLTQSPSGWLPTMVSVNNCNWYHKWCSHNQQLSPLYFFHIEENDFLEPELVVPQRGEEEDEVPSPPQSINKEEPHSTSRPYTDLDRNVVSACDTVGYEYVFHNFGTIYRKRIVVNDFFLSLQDILNHVLSDIEIFMAKVTAIVAKNTKKKKKKKKGKGNLVQKIKEYTRLYLDYVKGYMSMKRNQSAVSLHQIFISVC